MTVSFLVREPHVGSINFRFEVIMFALMGADMSDDNGTMSTGSDEDKVS
jgi:hypothetical protein